MTKPTLSDIAVWEPWVGPGPGNRHPHARFKAAAALATAASCLAASALLAPPAHATPSVTLAASFAEGSHLGEGTALRATATMTGSEYSGGPEPLSDLTLSLPAGTAPSNAGFPTCERATLESVGPAGCPPGSSAGTTGSWNGVVSFGSERVPEQGQLEPFFAPGGGIFLFISAVTPVVIEAIAVEHYESATGSFGPRANIEVPLIESIPAKPFVSMTEFSFSLGVSRQEGGQTVASVVAPAACPQGVFGWRADASFSDEGNPLPETAASAEALSSCLSSALSPSPPVAAPSAGASAPPSAPQTSLAPVFGRIANLQPVSGVILIELPGTRTFVRLGSVSSVPLGTLIDARKGTVQLTSAADAHGRTQAGQFQGGVFRISQTSSRSPLRGGGAVAITVLSLAGDLPTGCSAGRRSRIAAARKPRRLWGDAHGNFRTQGRYASATVRGTQWLTEDTCAGTLVKVARGAVSVRDIPHHRAVLVRAPNSFLSHPGHGG